MDIAVAKRLARPHWLNARVVLGTTLVGLSLVGGRAVVASTDTTTAVLAAVNDIQPGTQVTSDLLTIERVHLSPALLRTYVTAGSPVEGLTVQLPIPAGALIPEASLRESPGGAEGRAITIPVEPDHAVGGVLRAGDRVDVYATFDSSDVRARTEVLIRAAPVIDIVSDGGFVAGDRSIVGVTVAVDPDVARRIAFAARIALLDVARVDGGSAEVLP